MDDEGRRTPTAPTELMTINPFFIVNDFETSVSYYVNRLGFGLDFQGPDDDRPFYCRVSRDGAGIRLKAILPDVHPHPNRAQHEWARWDAFILTTDPDGLHEEFTRRGASFVSELSPVDAGLWGFEVADADGYVLCFARPEHT